MSAHRIDVDDLKSRISLEDVIGAHGVKLAKIGKELSALCPFHSEKTPSFKVTPSEQLYYCAGCGAGGDSIAFIREYHGIGFKDAARKLAELAGGSIEPANDNAAARRESRRPDETPPKWIKQATPPDDEPPLDTLRVLRGGEWHNAPVAARWAYRNRAGALVGYANRIEFEKPDGTTGKDVIPTTWQVNTRTGELAWRQGAFDAPRPLYGAELLDANPAWNVIIVEGEKACDAARRLLAGRPFLVLTWPGGCKAVDKADWSALAGRRVVGWPDCDSQCDRDGNLRAYLEQPGMAAMLRIADLLADHGVDMRIVAVPQPGMIDDGWDLADAEVEGQDGDKVLEAIKTQLATPAELRERHAQADPPPDPADDEPPPPTKATKKSRRDDMPPATPASFGDTEPFRCLGYNHGRYYYIAGRQGQVHEYSKSDHTPTGLVQLADLDYWQNRFAFGEEMKGKHWLAATNAMMRLCERRGIFDTSILRGRGCWHDEGRLVMNLGDRLMVDGDDLSHEQIDNSSRFIYERAAKMAGPADSPLSVEKARYVLDVCKRFNWERPASAALLAGWVVLAPLCGALPWRPHVWITGGTGSGKSTILGKFIAPLMAGTELQAQGNSTEAGIRQKLRADARPVIFDESEQNNEREEQRVQNILSLVRQASSESDALTLKGTTAGRQLEFHIRSMFCMASIQVGIQRQADHTRIAILGLHSDGKPDQWQETQRLLYMLQDEPDYGSRLMARSIAMYDTIVQNMRTMVKTAAAYFGNQRLGDQYGTLLAGAAALMYDHPITEEGAKRFIALFDWGTYVEPAREDESGDAMGALMQIPVRCEVERGTVTLTTGELVGIVVDHKTKDGVSPTDAAGHLGRLGFKVERPSVGDHGFLLVANKSERLKRELRGQPWSTDWRGYIRRLPGAKAREKVVRFCDGHVGRATEVPIEVALPAGQDEG